MCLKNCIDYKRFPEPSRGDWTRFTILVLSATLLGPCSRLRKQLTVFVCDGRGARSPDGVHGNRQKVRRTDGCMIPKGLQGSLPRDAGGPPARRNLVLPRPPPPSPPIFGDAEKCVYLHTDKSEFPVGIQFIEAFRRRGIDGCPKMIEERPHRPLFFYQFQQHLSTC